MKILKKLADKASNRTVAAWSYVRSTFTSGKSAGSFAPRFKNWIITNKKGLMNAGLFLGGAGLGVASSKLISFMNSSLSKTNAELMNEYGQDPTPTSINQVNRAAYLAAVTKIEVAMGNISYASNQDRGSKLSNAGSLVDNFLLMCRSIGDPEIRDFVLECLADGVELQSLGLQPDLGFSHDSTVRGIVLRDDIGISESVDAHLFKAIKYSQARIPLRAV
jgi:hypothetical protein